MRALVLAIVLGVSVVSFGDAASAQEEDQAAEDRASTFRAVSGPQVDRVPGGKLLIAAYGVAWVFMLGYLWRLGALHAANTRELERLENKSDDE